MFRKRKEILERIEVLERYIRLRAIPIRSDACASCEKAVPCTTFNGDFHYCCIKDVLEKCPEFTLKKPPQSD